MEIEPAYAHMPLQSEARQGLPPMRTLGLVGIHAPAGCGIQGCGVRTPRAAAVAAATWGLASDVHSPKGPTFTSAEKSEMVPQGLPPAKTLALVVTLRGAGAVPMVHMHDAVAVTSSLIFLLCFLLFFLVFQGNHFSCARSEFYLSGLLMKINRP